MTVNGTTAERNMAGIGRLPFSLRTIVPRSTPNNSANRSWLIPLRFRYCLSVSPVMIVYPSVKHQGKPDTKKRVRCTWPLRPHIPTCGQGWRWL